jgi:hypothetical protein
MDSNINYGHVEECTMHIRSIGWFQRMVIMECTRCHVVLARWSSRQRWATPASFLNLEQLHRRVRFGTTSEDTNIHGR